jgi:cytoskeletal protein CcmA (bactofilin family)
MDSPKTAEIAHIGRSVIIKGELSGSEDLYVDGQVEGTIELQGNSLTVGPNGQLRANVNAKNVVVHGRLEGNVRSSERAELKKSAVAIGDISAQKIAIEDGAYFKGRVDIQKEVPKAAVQPPLKAQTPLSPGGTESSTTTSTSAAAVGAPSGGAITSEKTPVTEQKKI